MTIPEEKVERWSEKIKATLQAVEDYHIFLSEISTIDQWNEIQFLFQRNNTEFVFKTLIEFNQSIEQQVKEVHQNLYVWSHVTPPGSQDENENILEHLVIGQINCLYEHMLTFFYTDLCSFVVI